VVRTKKIVAVLIIMLMGISLLSGCKKETNTNPSGDKKVTITMEMHVANVQEQDPVTWAIVQKFMDKNPNIKVELTGAETNEHVKRMKMAAQSNTLPDIFWMLPAPAKEMAQAGNILDLNEIISKNSEITAKIPASLVGALKDGDFQYGLPYQVLVTGFWYNKSIFAKYGVKEPAAGTTFEELTEMIKTFKKNNVVTVSKGAKDPFSVWAFLTFYERYGYTNKISSILNKTEKFNNPDFLNMYKKIDTMRTLGAFPANVSTMNYFQAVEAFTSGQAAMLDAGIWEAPKIDKALGQNAGFWWGPTFSDGVGNQKVSMDVPAAPFVVSAAVKKDADKLDAVAKFLKFYYSDEAAQIMVDNETMPVITFSGTVDKQKFPAFAAVVDQVSNKEWVSPAAQPDLVVTEAVQNAMYDSIYGVINGTYTPEQALDVVDKKIAEQ
jgi:raffinose/stachyose/melibiose transport system substrate-binding protein